MRAEKVQIIQEIKGLIEDKPFFLISFKGLTTAHFSSFRAILIDLQAQCHVVPNNLFHQAAKELNLTAVVETKLAGDTALVSGDFDPVALAKAVRDLSKAHTDKVNIKFGFVEGTLVNRDQVVALADLPPREVLQAQLLGLLLAPAGQMVRVLNAKVSSIVYVLNAFLGKKEQAA